jgi:hypothetical protein
VSAELRIGAGSAFADAGGGELLVNAGDGEAAPAISVEAEPDWTRVELVRHIACRLEDGTAIAIAAARPKGAQHHDQEARTAVLVDPDGAASTPAAVLLSTEYGPDGEPRRLGIELEFEGDEEAPPMRGAAVREGDAFEFTVDGRSGPGSYELIKAP